MAPEAGAPEELINSSVFHHLSPTRSLVNRLWAYIYIWENEPPQKVTEMRCYSKVVFGMRMGTVPIHIERISFE